MGFHIPNASTLTANLWVLACGIAFAASFILALRYSIPMVQAFNAGDDRRGIFFAIAVAGFLVAGVIFGNIGIAHMSDPVNLWPDPSATDLIPPPLPAQPTPPIHRV